MSIIESENNEDLIEKSESQTEVNNDDIDIIPDEVLEAIPEEERGKFKSIVRQTMISGVMKRNNPISEKITSEHITELIKNSDNQDLRDRDERKTDKNYQIIFLLIGLAFLVFLIIFLQNNEDLLYKIILAIISFLGGFGIGKSSQSKSKQED